MKKLLMNLTALSSLVISGNSVIPSLVQNTSNNTLNHKSVKNLDEAQDISDVLTNLNLGFIETGGVNPSETQVKNYVSRFNPNVNIAYISINGITSSTAVVTGNNPLYYGSVKISFTITQLVELSEVLTETDLGTIFTAESKPVANQIKTALKNDGVNPNLDVNAIAVQNITATSATIVGDELKYTGTINVTFNVKRVEDMVNWHHGAIRAVTVNSNGIFVGTNDAKYNGNVYMSTNNGQSFTVLRGTAGAIVSLVSDKNGNVYAATETSSTSGKVYASDGISSFGIIPGIPADSFAKYTVPRNLSIDKNGNIYVVVKYTNFGLGFAEVYKSLGTTGFRIVSGDYFGDGEGLSVAVDNNGTVYAGTRTATGRGELYKFMTGDTAFKKVAGITAEVRSLVSDKNGNIFVGVRTGDGSGTVYVGSNNNNNFNLISGTIGSVYNLTADKLGNVYAGTRTAAGIGALYKSSGGSDFSIISGTIGIVYGIGFDEVSGGFYAGTTLPGGTTGKLYRGS